MEKKKAETELERLRATDVTRSKIVKETAQQTAEDVYYTKIKYAKATSYSQKQEAEAYFYRASKEADAQRIRATKEADSHLYTKKKEAEGLNELARAYGATVDALGGP